MGPRHTSSFQSHNYFQRLSKALEFAVSEWVLMFLLFIDACFAYLIAKFASYCQLQGPCLLCSRYDHVLAKDKTGIYWDPICNHHKSKISSLVLCHVHDKLVDVHGICENCLLSFATETKNKFKAESFRLLVGKMRSNPLLEDRNCDSSSSRICFCCNEQYASRDYTKNLLRSIHSDASESLFANGEHAKNEKNIFVDKSLESFRSSHMGKNQIALSSEVEYQKANVNSDSESEFLVSDNGSARALIPEVHLKSDSQFEVLDLHHDRATAATCGTEEDTSRMTEQISFDEVPSSIPEKSDSQFEVFDLHHDPATVAPRDTEKLKWPDDANKEDTSQMTERISFDKVPSSNAAVTPADAFLETTDPPRTGEMIKDPVTESEPSTTTNGHQVSNYLDLGDAYKLAVSSKGRQLSGKLLDQKSFQDSSTRVGEDLKILLSHRSNDNLISPKLSFNSDELMGVQFLQRRISLERNESSLSLDGSVVSEIDGESAVDRLRRQVEHDKKLMGILYKELEEERNASAVATNQAMAMITRLQEEKAALYTEALQCLRMMEEQAEYNSEALQKANDLIEEKEKQIQDLEELLRKASEGVTE